MVLSTRRERRAKARFLQRHADRFDAVALRQPERNFNQSRQHVHVFVAVKVRWPDACLAHLANLRTPFPLDFSEKQAAPRPSQQQAFRPAGKLALAVEQAHHASWLRHGRPIAQIQVRSEEHTSELQSRLHLVCRLLLEKKKTKPPHTRTPSSCCH